MRLNRVYQNRRTLSIVVCVSALAVGLVLLFAGTGKLPGQTEFAEALMGTFFTSALAFLISRVLPWVEIGLAVCLLLGIFPRLAALACLPLFAGFMVNNGWALMQGVGKFAKCADCFGFWEKIFGSLSPRGALAVDIGLFCAALAVVILYPGFFRSGLWFVRSDKRSAESRRGDRPMPQAGTRN